MTNIPKRCASHKVIIDLNDDIVSGVARTLDNNQKWLELLGEISRQDRCSLSEADRHDVERGAIRQSPGHTLLYKLGLRAMSVQSLVQLLTYSSLERALSNLYLLSQEVIILEQQPERELQASPGDSVTLRCKVLGSSSVKYQWYYNNKKIPDQTEACLKIPCLSYEFDLGVYQCRIHTACMCNDRKYTYLFSRKCHLVEKRQVITPPISTLDSSGKYTVPPFHQTGCCSASTPDSLGKYTAKDKVALLIGNCNYRTAPPLPAVKNDLLAFKEKLKKLDFRVLSYIDLDLREMEVTLLSFISMLEEGVYGVFYYAGHGFECDHQSYMMPTDCKTGITDPEASLPVSRLLEMMERKRPALCVLFMDMCRLTTVPPATCTNCNWRETPQLQRGVDYRPFCTRCNLPLSFTMPSVPCRLDLPHHVQQDKAIFYAATSGAVAFEHEDASQGIFMKSLLKCLDVPKTMPSLYECITTVFLENYSGNLQKPEVVMNILKPRTLHDAIIHNTESVEFRRKKVWEAHHAIPPDQTITFPSGVIITVDFREMLSNLLMIDVMLYSFPHQVEVLDVQLKHPQELSFLPEVDYYQEKNKVSTVKNSFSRREDKKQFKLSEIQKLQGNLKITLKLNMRVRGQMKVEEKDLDLERPLVSYIWHNLCYVLDGFAH